jgi:hypothetical protein
VKSGYKLSRLIKLTAYNIIGVYMPTAELELKDPEISFKGGTAEKVNKYPLFNSRPGMTTYRREGDRYFEDHFDEHHGTGCKEEEVPPGSLPEDVMLIFEAGTRQAVERLKEEGRIDKYYKLLP